MTGAAGADLVDAHVGRRLQLARVATGWSRAELAGRLGIEIAALAELESGARAVPAGRLYGLAALFEVSIQYFFDGLAATALRAGPEGVQPAAEAPEADPQLLRLVGAYHGLADEALRAALVELVARMPGGLTRGRRRTARVLRFEPPLRAD